MVTTSRQAAVALAERPPAARVRLEEAVRVLAEVEALVDAEALALAEAEARPKAPFPAIW